MRMTGVRNIISAPMEGNSHVLTGADTGSSDGRGGSGGGSYNSGHGIGISGSIDIQLVC